jgi:hypothetical protein
MFNLDLRRMLTVTLVLTTVFITMPVSAADFSTAKSVIGSVSAVGPVELRGIGISQEGTLFAGDSIRAGVKGYAKVLLGTGNKIELAEGTQVQVNRDAQGVKIAMNTGTLGFTAPAPIRIDILPFEVVATDGAAGNVAIINLGSAGVRSINGKVTVRNLKTAETFDVFKGQERLLSLQNGAHAPSLAEIASNVPGPLPAPSPNPTPAPVPAPQAPAGKTTGGMAMDTGAWLAVIGGAAVAGVAIWGLVVALNNRDNVHDLQSQVNTLTVTNQQALKNVSNAAALANSVSQLQTQMATVSALASQAQLALTLAGNSAAAAQAASIATQATATQAQLNALQSQIQALQAQFASGGGSAAQLNGLLAQEETLRATSNSLTNQLNALLAANRSTPGVPQTTVNTVGPPTVASASVPV